MIISKIDKILIKSGGFTKKVYFFKKINCEKIIKYYKFMIEL